jgi:hypothetical protein
VSGSNGLTILAISIAAKGAGKKNALLKLLALLVMTVDHANRVIWSKESEWMVIIGRFAFPLFAFLIARNSLYTSNPWKYLGRLLVFAAISQPIYALALDHSWLSPLNVLFTLTLGLLAVTCWRQGWFLLIPLPFLFGYFVEYGVAGVAAVGICSLLIETLQAPSPASLLKRYGILAGGIGGLLFLCTHLNTIFYLPWVVAAFSLGFATLLIPSLARLEACLDWRGGRWFFYAFYPGHLALLLLLEPFLSRLSPPLP